MDKISTTKKNILEYIESQKLSKKSFYESIGMSESNFKGKGLNSEIGSDKIGKILTIYPDINAEWLLTGKGNMLKGVQDDYIDEVVPPDSLNEPNESFYKRYVRSLEISNELTKENYSLISSIRDWIKKQDDFVGECFSVEDNEGNTILTEDDL